MRVGPHNGVLVALQEDQEKTQVHILANNTLCCNKARRPWPDATTTVRDFLASISNPDKSLSLSDFFNSGRKLTKASWSLIQSSSSRLRPALEWGDQGEARICML